MPTVEPHSRALTPKEQQVHDLLVLEGLTDGEMAARLGMTERAVKFHVQNLLQKTGAPDRFKMAVAFWRSWSHYDEQVPDAPRPVRRRGDARGEPEPSTSKKRASRGSKGVASARAAGPRSEAGAQKRVSSKNGAVDGASGSGRGARKNRGPTQGAAPGPARSKRADKDTPEPARRASRRTKDSDPSGRRREGREGSSAAGHESRGRSSKPGRGRASPSRAAGVGDGSLERPAMTDRATRSKSHRTETNARSKTRGSSAEVRGVKDASTGHKVSSERSKSGGQRGAAGRTGGRRSRSEIAPSGRSRAKRGTPRSER